MSVRPILGSDTWIGAPLRHWSVTVGLVTESPPDVCRVVQAGEVPAHAPVYRVCWSRRHWRVLQRLLQLVPACPRACRSVCGSRRHWRVLERVLQLVQRVHAPVAARHWSRRHWQGAGLFTQGEQRAARQRPSSAWPSCVIRSPSCLRGWGPRRVCMLMIWSASRLCATRSLSCGRLGPPRGRLALAGPLGHSRERLVLAVRSLVDGSP